MTVQREVCYCCTTCCTFWCCKIWRLTREHERAISPARGITGRLSQLHISIMNPSGSWKNSWSTWIPPSSTIARTYSIAMSFSFFSTASMLSHCMYIYILQLKTKINYLDYYLAAIHQFNSVSWINPYFFQFSHVTKSTRNSLFFLVEKYLRSGPCHLCVLGTFYFSNWSLINYYNL